MIEVGQCKICTGWYRLVDNRLPEHIHLTTKKPCRGRLPRQSKINEYTVGWDHHPREINGGAWEMNRRKH